MIATGVVRGRPLFRPRMVISPLKPSGTPAAKRNLTMGLKNEKTHRGGTRMPGTPGVVAALTTRSLMRVAPSCVDSFGVPHIGDPQEGRT